MKDHIKDNSAESYEDANGTTDNYIYLFQDNNDICQFARLTPNEYDEYCLTVYPLIKSNPDQSKAADRLAKDIMSFSFVKSASHR